MSENMEDQEIRIEELRKLLNPNQPTYSYNFKEVPFEELPPQLQAEILEAEDFWCKVDNASCEEQRKELLETHPYNQTDSIHLIRADQWREKIRQEIQRAADKFGQATFDQQTAIQHVSANLKHLGMNAASADILEHPEHLKPYALMLCQKYLELAAGGEINFIGWEFTGSLSEDEQRALWQALCIWKFS